MEKKSATVGVLGHLLRLEPHATGLHARLTVTTPSSRKVNGPASPFRAGNSTERRNIHQKVAQGPWANTWGLDCAELGKPIIDLVQRQISWERYMGQPMAQKVPGTCVLLACIVCLQAVHHIEYEKKLHREEGAFPFQFPWHCMATALRRLFLKCVTDDTWVWGQGASVGKVLNKIQEIGGLPATNAPTLEQRVLQLRSWQAHRWDSAAGGLSPERVAKLLYSNGPCIGLLWVVSPWYRHVDADRDDTAVYTTGGCGRSDDIRRLIEDLSPGQVGWHALVCVSYRFRGDQMHVLVLDNHSATGPRRWIHVKEFHTLYTMSV